MSYFTNERLKEIRRYDIDKYKVFFNITIDEMIGLLYLNKKIESLNEYPHHKPVGVLISYYKSRYCGEKLRDTEFIKKLEDNTYQEMCKNGLTYQTESGYNLSSRGLNILEKLNIFVNGNRFQKTELKLATYKSSFNIILSIISYIN